MCRGGGGASERELEALAIYMGALSWPRAEASTPSNPHSAVQLLAVLQPDITSHASSRVIGWWRVLSVLYCSVRRAQRADAAGELRPAHEGGEGGAGGGAAGEHHAAGSERSHLMPADLFASSLSAVLKANYRRYTMLMGSPQPTTSDLSVRSDGLLAALKIQALACCDLQTSCATQPPDQPLQARGVAGTSCTRTD